MASLSKREHDELRSWLVQRVAQMLGYPDSSVVSAAMQCVQKGYDSKSTTDALSKLLEDSAPQLVGSLFEKLNQIKGPSSQGPGAAPPLRSVTSKRSVKEAFGEEGAEESNYPIPKRPRPDPESLSGPVPVAQPAAVSAVPASTGLPVATPILNSNQISDILARTRQQIEEKKAALANQQRLPFINQALAAQQAAAPPAVTAAASVPGLASLVAGSPLQQAALDAQRKKAELQQRVQAQLANQQIRASLAASGQAAPGAPGAAPNASAEKPMPLILDSQGRTIDATGKAVQLTAVQPSIKANIRAKQRENFKIERPSTEDLMDNNPYYDPRVSINNSQRTKRSFKFHDAGKFQQLAQKLRAKKQLEKLQESIASVAKKTGISSATKLALITPSTDAETDQIPDVEWWDKVVMPVSEGYDEVVKCIQPLATSGLATSSSGGSSTEDASGQPSYRNITQLVEHPVPFYTNAQKKAAPVLAVQLTKQERKKLRTQRRREAEKEKQEKVSLGLMPPPPPKVKMSNLMRVLGSEAVQDPTKMEAYVRSEMAKRQRAHESSNAARKLTPDQRKDKKLKKLDEDVSCGVDVQVYRVTDLTDPKVRYKVDINAQQLHLTGCIVQSKDLNLVVVEGGPKSLKKYKRLMMNRINWDEARRNMDKNLRSDNSDQPNQCSVVWEGMVEARNFVDWKCKQFPVDSGAREFLKKFNVHHYWDLALSSSIIEGTED
ncbi:U4/U6 small nuclear ribonucleoprotein Prp3-like [Sycon ciliatum]|uniref:U4/U6 small nuclear ribonucleoprotein Prp3-like n=1 Tax=Sycon ciliatum TaxID=27933 RepID=UPI0020AC7FA1|eukprot:scpid47532/ scgid9952/ U4/U6 small nuclear ribonucleoprotein Prp3; Pre-mRNA-splicing factor 3